jgi:hypothetical protein
MGASVQMTAQRIHSQFAPIDVLTRDELAHEMTTHMDAFLRERYRGLEIQRFPRIMVTATAATQALTASNDETPIGPEQGDVWMVRRVIVKGFALADAAKYILFRGSTPSDITNGYTGFTLLEGFAASAAGQSVGIGYYPGTKSVFLQPGEQIYAQVLSATIGNQYILEGEAIRVPAEMKGKVL